MAVNIAHSRPGFQLHQLSYWVKTVTLAGAGGWCMQGAPDLASTTPARAAGMQLPLGALQDGSPVRGLLAAERPGSLPSAPYTGAAGIAKKPDGSPAHAAGRCALAPTPAAVEGSKAKQAAGGRGGRAAGAGASLPARGVRARIQAQRGSRRRRTQPPQSCKLLGRCATRTLPVLRRIEHSPLPASLSVSAGAAIMTIPAQWDCPTPEPCAC